MVAATQRHGFIIACYSVVGFVTRRLLCNCNRYLIPCFGSCNIIRAVLNGTVGYQRIARTGFYACNLGNTDILSFVGFAFLILTVYGVGISRSVHGNGNILGFSFLHRHSKLRCLLAISCSNRSAADSSCRNVNCRCVNRAVIADGIYTSFVRRRNGCHVFIAGCPSHRLTGVQNHIAANRQLARRSRLSGITDGDFNVGIIGGTVDRAVCIEAVFNHFIVYVYGLAIHPLRHGTEDKASLLCDLSLRLSVGIITPNAEHGTSRISDRAAHEASVGKVRSIGIVAVELVILAQHIVEVAMSVNHFMRITNGFSRRHIISIPARRPIANLSLF